MTSEDSHLHTSADGIILFYNAASHRRPKKSILETVTPEKQLQWDARIWNAADCIINSWVCTLKHDSWWNVFPSSHIQGCVISLREASCSRLLAIPENPEENNLWFKIYRLRRFSSKCKRSCCVCIWEFLVRTDSLWYQPKYEFKRKKRRSLSRRACFSIKCMNFLPNVPVQPDVTEWCNERKTTNHIARYNK